jgi:hypothetical protein
MVSAGRLVLLFPDLPLPSPTAQAAIHAVRMPGRSHAARAQLFISHLWTEFGEPAYWDQALAMDRSR